jgi:hypothetical protein
LKQEDKQRPGQQSGTQDRQRSGQQSDESQKRQPGQQEQKNQQGFGDRSQGRKDSDNEIDESTDQRKVS